MERYGCQVHSFDPAMLNATEDFDRSPHVHFHALALNDIDQGDKNRTLSSIFHALNHQRDDDIVVDFVKLDIEGDEWAIIPQMLRPGGVLMDRVKQLAVEVHLKTDGDLAYYRRMVGIVKSLEDHGWTRFDSYYNHWSWARFPGLDNRTGPFAYIMAWYNSKFLS